MASLKWRIFQSNIFFPPFLFLQSSDGIEILYKNPMPPPDPLLGFLKWFDKKHFFFHGMRAIDIFQDSYNISAHYVELYNDSKNTFKDILLGSHKNPNILFP